MLDPTNLPLSRKKIWKKTIETIITTRRLMSTFLMAILILNMLTTDQFSMFNISRTLGFAFIGLCFAIVTLSVWRDQYHYYKSYYYRFEENGAEIKKGAFPQTTGHVRYDQIQTAYVDQDPLDRLFGLYDVHYETAGEQSGPYSHIDGLTKENADTLIAFLNKKTRQETQNTKTQEKTASAKTPSAKRTMPKMEYTRENCPISEKIILATIIEITIPLLVIAGTTSLALPVIYTKIGLNDLVIATAAIYGLMMALAISVGIIWYNNFHFKFDDEKGEITSKVIGTTTAYIYYDRIQNISIEQGIFGRIFGLYELSIEIAGDSSKITLFGLEQENANKLKDFLLAQAKRYRKI